MQQGGGRREAEVTRVICRFHNPGSHSNFQSVCVRAIFLFHAANEQSQSIRERGERRGHQPSPSPPQYRAEALKQILEGGEVSKCYKFAAFINYISRDFNSASEEHDSLPDSSSSLATVKGRFMQLPQPLLFLLPMPFPSGHGMPV